MPDPSTLAAPSPVSPQSALWRDPVVFRRIVEFLGGESLESVTCQFIGVLDPDDPSSFTRHSPLSLETMLEQGHEISRSLGDRDSMLIHLDIEYVNFDAPAAAFIDAPRVFELQQPLVETIESALLGYGIRYLHLLTGQGHHFIWKIPKSSRIARDISSLGILTPPDSETSADPPLFGHLALLMEFFAHRIKRESAAACDVPVEITARCVGPGLAGTREMLSIDISEYGDPLESRMIRIPYTSYRKPWVSGLIHRLGIGHRVQAFHTLPVHESSVAELLRCRHRPGWILPLARRASVEIPTQERGMARLLKDYLASAHAGFHRYYYQTSQDPPSTWESGYHRLPLDLLPPCAQHVLRHPNDLLLKPAAMQLVVRCLLAAGWPPRHIAGLIRSRFCDSSHDWGTRWIEYDPTRRAEFYTRLFAGEILLQLDRGMDFNCTSQQEKSLCWNPSGCSLEPYRRQLDLLPRHPQPKDNAAIGFLRPELQAPPV